MQGFPPVLSSPTPYCRLLRAGLVLVSSLLLVSACGPEGEWGTAHEPAYFIYAGVWPSPVIPVCWQAPNPAHERERRWVREAIEATWVAESNVRFTGWGPCGNASDGVVVEEQDTRPYAQLGWYGGGPVETVLNFTYRDYASFCAREALKEVCVKTTAVHEFGHLLALHHEQARADTPASCPREDWDGPYLARGPWDAASVMNYCSPYNSTPVNRLTVADTQRLSAGDIEVLRYLYGYTPPGTATPVVDLVAPRRNMVHNGGDVALHVRLPDAAALSRVDVRVNGEVVATFQAPLPAEIKAAVPLNDNKPAWYTLQVMAYTRAGASGYALASIYSRAVADVDRQPPQVSFIGLPSGTRLASPARINVQATDNRALAEVRLAVNGLVRMTRKAAPYEFFPVDLSPGTHQLTATAQDAAGNTASATVTVVVPAPIPVDRTPPRVSILSPTAGSIIAGDIQVSLSAADDQGVTRVELFVGSRRVGVATAAPYRFPLAVAGLADGRHTLTARAFDAAGNAAQTSIAITLQRRATTPSPAAVNPWTNPRNSLDVNDDGLVTTLDVLLLVNALNGQIFPGGKLPATNTGSFYYDVNGDGYLTALDVVRVVNVLNPS